MGGAATCEGPPSEAAHWVATFQWCLVALSAAAASGAGPTGGTAGCEAEVGSGEIAGVEGCGGRAAERDNGGCLTGW
jgi:hypothetical protein